MRKRTKNILLVVFLGMLMILYGTDVFARSSLIQASTFDLAKMSSNREAQTAINIGNWGFWITYDGQTGHDPFTGSSGGYYPIGTSSCIYMDGVIWGGYLKDSGNPSLSFPDSISLRVGGIGYRIGTVPGYVDASGTPIGSDDSRVHVYRIRSDWKTLIPSAVASDAAMLNNVTLADVTEAMELEVIENYKLDWKEWPVDLGAPYVDVNGNGIYDPVLDDDGYADPNAGDYPGYANADQVIWLAANDFNLQAVNKHSGAPPIGLELQITLWAYNQKEATLGQIVFKKYRLINKSGTTIDSMFIAQYSDPDVGDYGDDLVGTDVDKSLHYAYNGGPVDAEYAKFGMVPPAVGYDFFQGPIVASDGDTAVFDLKYRLGYKNLPMTSFGYFAAGGDISDPPMGVYDFTLQWYNMLNGYTPTNDLQNPTPYLHGSGPLAGQPTKFPLDGDPVVDPTGASSDIDGAGDNMPAGDRRMFAATGPFTMAPGDTQEVVVAVVANQGSDYLSSISAMRNVDVLAQKLYDDLFTTIPKPPANPNVKAVPSETSILLNWGFDQDAYTRTEADNPLTGYNFEGYVVYQLPSASASLSDGVRIVTFDKVDGVETIMGKRFLPEYGQVVEVPVAFGTDKGIQRFFTIDKDYITGQALKLGTTYYFAVTAYNYNPAPTLIEDKALESSALPIAVTLQGPKPGVRYEGTAGDLLEVEHAAGESDGTVQVLVVDPSSTTGHDYTVTFEVDADTNSATYGEVVWNLIDVTDNSTVKLSKQPQLAPGAKGTENPIVDGLQVKVYGPPPGMNPYHYGVAYGDGSPTSMTYLKGWDFSGTRWISGTDWGGLGLFGGLDNGYNFFGSTITDGTQFYDVTLYWAGDTTGNSDVATSQAEYPDRWSKAAVYRRDLGYAFNGTGDVPFAAWDVENNRRLNICFVEDANAGSGNNLWDMGWNDTTFADLGGREYVFIMSSDYDSAANYDNSNWGPASDVLYAFWPSSRGSHPYLEAPFELMIFASNVNTSSDEFDFTAPAVTVDDATAKMDVEKVNVFPNPYYANNPLETDRFNRFVTFTHLPRKATIRIFNLAGVQVRKLEKDNDDQFLKWNLLNESNLPVASGLYIAHVDMPDLGKTKVLKVMIVQSKQILEFY